MLSDGGVANGLTGELAGAASPFKAQDLSMGGRKAASA